MHFASSFDQCSVAPCPLLSPCLLPLPLIRRLTLWQGTKALHSSSDPTLFEQAQQNYNQIVQYLLEAESVEGLSEPSLKAFKEIYGSSAFPCRLQGCLRSSLGFANEEERANHESTHTLNLLCKDSTCPYSNIGFRNARALKKHLQEFHPPPAVLDVPDSLHQPQATAHDAADSPDTAESTDDQYFDELGLPPELNRHPPLKSMEVERNDGFAISTTKWD